MLEQFCGESLTNSSVSNGAFHASVCMQHTLFVWIPSAFTIIFSAIFIRFAAEWKQEEKPLPFSCLFLLKTCLVAVLAALNMFAFIFNILTTTHASDILGSGLLVISFVINLATHMVRRRVGWVTSGVQHVSAVAFLLFGSPEFYFKIKKCVDSVAFLLDPLVLEYLIYFPVLFIYTLLLCIADPRKSGEDEKPESDSSFLSQITQHWYNRIPLTGYKRPLEIEDLYNLERKFTSSHYRVEWENEWNPRMKEYSERKEIAKNIGSSDKVEKPSIVATLFFVFKWELIGTFFLKIVTDILQYGNPFLLHQIISFISEPNAPVWQGLLYALLMFIISESRSLIQNTFFFIMFRLGSRFQSTLINAIYAKTLILSNSARKERTVGEIVNLMAIDVSKIEQITPQLHQYWSCPFQILLSLTYLYFTLGIAALPGLLVMIVIIPINIFTTGITRKWQIAQMKLKDKRTKMVNEVLSGIKVVKLYAWEVPMEQHIEDIRQQELVLINNCALVKNVSDAFNAACPFLVALFSFGTYVLSSSEHELTPQVAFVSLTLFNMLRFPMNILSFLINQTMQVIVANKRLKSFLSSSELDGAIVEELIEDSESTVKIENYSGNWDGDSAKPTLSDIDFEVTRGSFVAVVGKVASGKSSLLSSLIGEMDKLKGHIGRSGTLAYVPQQPWIQNLSLKDNILMGRPMDKAFYNKVVSACCLRPDIQMLPQGDQTEIGEKGINLSGGQKARVALARAVYQNCDVYLLDDPLSAVDAHVGKHILEKLLGPKGILKNKTRILVSHGLAYVKDADEIIVMEDGRITERGTFEKLVKLNGSFREFVDHSKVDVQEDEEDEDDEFDLECTHEAAKELNRQLSKTSNASILSKELEIEENQKLIKKETSQTGGVKWRVYHLFIRAATYFRSAMFFGATISFFILQVCRNFWLSAWSDEYEKPANSTTIGYKTRLIVFAAIGGTEALLFFTSVVSLTMASLAASKNLHHPLINNILKSPMSFFDTTPIGRIISRCTADIDTIDSSLPGNFRLVLNSSLQIIFAITVVCISTPLYTVVVIPLGVLYFMILMFYVPTSRQLRRLEGTRRGPIFSKFGETVNGVSSIRAFGRTEDFRVAFGDAVDQLIRCRYMNIVGERWLSTRLFLIGNLVVFFAAFFAVLSKEFGWSESPGVVGLSISYSLNIIDALSVGVRQMCITEANIVAVERVEEYTTSENEAPWEIISSAPPKSWPSEGNITFSKYSARYRPGLDLVLKNINLDICPGEKVGIVGRTGAGKSSFALALFRLTEAAEGEIVIDDIKIGNIGLHDLRSNLTIIPQDPVLFSGTLRFNLDPFNRFDSDDLWRVLELAHLKDMVSALPNGLEHNISEGGDNISVGQRQLVCLARALLRKSKILVLDEATAAVDVSTDSLIQKTIREQFSSCTIITIAHRINTILDYDRILVLDKGEICEFDSPAVLLQNNESAFAKLLAESKSQEKRS